MSEKDWEFIPVDKVPGRPYFGVYSKIVNDFLATGLEVAKFKGKLLGEYKIMSVIASLRKAGKGKIRVMKRGKDIYLMRLEPSERNDSRR